MTRGLSREVPPPIHSTVGAGARVHDNPPGDTRAAAFARLFEAVHEGVYIGDIGPDATVTFAANPQLKRVFGYAPEMPDADVRPFDPERFIDPDARVALLNRLRLEGTIADHLVLLRRVDRSALRVEVTARAEPTGGSGVIRVDALLRDVTERQRLDDETREMYRHLMQSEKMAALGQAISGVAHELNNPLATILSWAERISQKETDPGLRRGLDAIVSESQRAARIVRNLLTFARQRQSTRALIDVNQVARETIALRGYESRAANITVIDALSANMPPVFADAHQIKQVLLNLIINAEQAMLSAHGRGILIVRTRFDSDRHVVMLEVNDDGPGVPEDVRTKVFDPFFTTKSVGQGTGLGLTVAYAIVQEHGGRIRLESPVDGGTSFVVELPAMDDLAATTRTSPTPQTARETVREASVLVVEDETPLATAVAEALRDAGYVVQRAGDGEEAMAMVRAHSFDLVICDLKMPRVDGRAFYRLLCTSRPDMAHHVVFVTGDIVGADTERFFEESGCRWLAKPFRLEELLTTVRESL